MGRILLRLLGTSVVAFVCSIGGCATTAVLDQSKVDAETVKYYPLPHSTPKGQGPPFLFAMVHDVVHERYPKHGSEHYRERNRASRVQIASLAREGFGPDLHIDDLSVGLARIGEFDEAIRLQRSKLERQEKANANGRELYSTYANLGTFLMLANIGGLYAGDRGAADRFRESVELLKESVRANPDSHFGREIWQVIFGEFLLAAATDPNLLFAFDFLGNRLDLPVDVAVSRQRDGPEYGRPFTRDYAGDETLALRKKLAKDPDWQSFGSADHLRVRDFVAKVGAEDGWAASSTHTKAIPFDEPSLAIVGMWRQGGGANPHFALALAETMLRVGQRRIAWCAYERASRLADGFSGNAASNDFLRGHCRKRQAELENSLTTGARRDTNRATVEEIAELRKVFDAELAFGQAYQRAYQDYEAAKLGEGVKLDAPDFYGAFDLEHGPIASVSGPEEWYAAVPQFRMDLTRQFGGALVGAGLGAVLAHGLRRLIWRRRYPPAAPPG